MMLGSCSVVTFGGQAVQLEDGTYRNRQGGRAAADVYVTASGIDSLHIEMPDSLTVGASVLLYKTTLDLDFLTIPVKLRGARADIPAQLTTSINGQIFLGIRRDYFLCPSGRSPFIQDSWQHLGFSLGLFGGAGNATIKDFYLTTPIGIEYDGIVRSQGLSLRMAYGKLTFGLGAGTDVLLDKYASRWIYNGQLWYGLAFGLNLN